MSHSTRAKRTKRTKRTDERNKQTFEWSGVGVNWSEDDPWRMGTTKRPGWCGLNTRSTLGLMKGVCLIIKLR